MQLKFKCLVWIIEEHLGQSIEINNNNCVNIIFSQLNLIWKHLNLLYQPFASKYSASSLKINDLKHKHIYIKGLSLEHCLVTRYVACWRGTWSTEGIPYLQYNTTQPIIVKCSLVLKQATSFSHCDKKNHQKNGVWFSVWCRRFLD